MTFSKDKLVFYTIPHMYKDLVIIRSHTVKWRHGKVAAVVKC